MSGHDRDHQADAEATGPPQDPAPAAPSEVAPGTGGGQSQTETPNGGIGYPAQSPEKISEKRKPDQTGNWNSARHLVRSERAAAGCCRPTLPKGYRYVTRRCRAFGESLQEALEQQQRERFGEDYLERDLTPVQIELFDRIETAHRHALLCRHWLRHGEDEGGMTLGDRLRCLEMESRALESRRRGIASLGLNATEDEEQDPFGA